MKREVSNIDFVTKDYEGFRQLMIDLIPTYTPEWTDTSQSDMGIVLIELLAHGLDILSYYQDKAINENFLETAKTRKAVIKLCKMLGYELSPQKPAVHKIVFTKTSEYLEDEIIIPKGIKLSTDAKIGTAIVFELNNEVVIPSGVQSAEGYATHGTSIYEDIIGVAQGVPNEKFKLSYADALIDTLVIMTNENGINRRWTRVRDFLSSKPTDRHFITSTDEYNRITVEFGSGQTGLAIPKDAIVTASYRVGGGEIGNVGTNTITQFYENEIAGVTLTNPEIPYEYGEDVEDIEHAKITAPRAYRSIERAVTAQDFGDLMLSQYGVSKAKCVETFNENGDLHIYIVPTYYDTLPQNLKDDLLEYANKVKLINVNPIILDPVYKEFSIEVNVIAYSNYVNSELKAKIEERLQDVFSKKYIEFGEQIYVASIYKEIMSIEGVRNASIITPEDDIAVGEAEIAKLLDVKVNVQGGVDM